MKLALDTNRYTDFCRGVPEVAVHLSQAESICLPLMVLGELRAGFQVGSRSRENEQILARFLASPRVSLLLPDQQTTLHYANLYSQLRRQGTPIPVNDLWIAALVLQHELVLLSRDGHFKHLPQLPRIE